jgi:hypothetical protein
MSHFALELRLLFGTSFLPGIARLGAAQESGPSITATPDSLAIGPGGEDQALVVFRNKSDTTLCTVRFSSLSNRGIQVRFSDSLITSVARGAAVATTVFVRRGADGDRPATIVIRAAFRNGHRGTPGIALTGLKLVGDRLATAEQAAGVTLSSSAEMLSAREPGMVFVIVTNKTELPLEVRHIRADGQFIEADTSLRRGWIPAHGVGAFGIDLRPKTRVRPGKHTMVFDVALAWGSRTGNRTGNVVLAHEVDVGVFGEPAVLKVLSVPSFLLLPGFLMIVAFGLTWQFRNFLRRAKSADFPLKPTSADFWVIAITLSGMMAFILAWCLRSDYFSTYGTKDLVIVWLLSVALGIVAGVVWFGWTYLWSTPATKDSPLTILRKLGRQWLGIDCEKVEIDGKTRYLLQRLPLGEGPVWVGPAIEVAWQSTATDGDRTRFNNLRASRKARPLAKFLKAAQARQVVRIGWTDGATPTRVSVPTVVGSGIIIEPQEA